MSNWDYKLYKEHEKNRQREAKNYRTAQEVQKARKELLPARRRRTRS